MLCGVTATLGSNPSATATAARPHWGRAVLLCLRGVCVGGLLPRQISGRRAACPPARRPRRELRSVRRLVVRPGPAGLAAASNRSGCLCVAWPRRLRASQPGPPVTAGALHAGGAFVADVAGASARCSARPRRPRAPRPGPPAPPTPSMLAAVGVCSIRGWLSACRRRVMVLMTPFPPFGDGEITV